MKKLLIRSALNILSKWLTAKVKNEKLLALFLFLIHAVYEIAGIVTDDNKDDSAQLEAFAEEELPKAVEIFNAFIAEKKAA